MKIDVPKIIELPQVKDRRGNLCVIEPKAPIPFEIKRVYYLFDVPGGAERGGHAHKKLKQFVIAINGSFDVILDDGKSKEKYHLDRSFLGLYIPKMIWRELNNFSSGSVCLIIASEKYSEEDYIRNYDEYRSLQNKIS